MMQKCNMYTVYLKLYIKSDNTFFKENLNCFYAH